MKKLILLISTAIILSAAGAALADGRGHKGNDKGGYKAGHGYSDSRHGNAAKYKYKRHQKRHWKYRHGPRHGYRDRRPHRGYVYRPLPVPHVLRYLRQHRYYSFDRVRLRDGHYRLHAYDRRHRPVRLIVDAFTGFIIASRYGY